MDHDKTKIAIISHSLGEGGAERFAGELSFMLNDLQYEVHHIIVNDNVDYPFSGQLYNLGQLCQGDSGLLKKIKKGKLLHQYLKNKNINIIIDNRTRNSLIRELLTVLIYGNRKIYYIIHSYHLENYLPKSVFFAKLLCKNAQKLICVSKAIEEKVFQTYGFKNTVTIYNPVKKLPITEMTSGDVPENYILFYGRLEEQVKNFTLLLQAFSESKIDEKGFQLVILGNGPSKKTIQETIEKLQLVDSVTLIPFQKDPFAYVRKARFTILTSYYEGFPMSIIESLSLGTPVISVDCNSGPKEIIVNEKNGLLVPNHDPVLLGKAMSRFVEDSDLYEYCKKNATQSVSHLSFSEISAQWQSVLEE
ncbi:glycosyltransferase [Flavobacterium sp.]|uniref:glycosyltransferase n=1 Tax=Flavobacterium sp. TaxID=239 RepID=UPI00261C4F7C|nr:glycosyltransferase [Flavobacterium sp.]